MAESHKKKIENLERLFEPVMDFSVAQGFKIQQILEAVKVTMIFAAARDLEKNNQKITVAKLSVMTGIHRRDVVRIFQSGEKKEDEIDLISRIVSFWSYHKKYSSRPGKPIALNRKKFDELVSKISKELKPTTILFEMERNGYIKIDDDQIKLKTKTAISNKDLTAGYKLLSADIGDLITAVTSNLQEKGDSKHLHAKTEFDAIPRSLVPEIRQWLLDKGAEYHQEVQEYLACLDQDLNSDKKYDAEARDRVAFATFGVIEENE